MKSEYFGINENIYLPRVRTKNEVPEKRGTAKIMLV